MNISEKEIDSLITRYADDAHFSNIVLPRLRVLLAVQKEMNSNLIWTLNYSATNRMENCLNISLPDERQKFHFYYSIPLGLRLSIHLYLGDNTFNFFEAHPFLIKQGVISTDEYKVEATINTLPHLVLTQRSDKYEQALLNKTDFSSQELKNSTLYKALQKAFEKFNPVLTQIIDGTLQM